MSRRTDRLGELFRIEISKLLQKGLKDPRVGFATINRVDITEDLAAKVLVSVMGSDKENAIPSLGYVVQLVLFVSFLGKELKFVKFLNSNLYLMKT